MDYVSFREGMCLFLPSSFVIHSTWKPEKSAQATGVMIVNGPRSWVVALLGDSVRVLVPKDIKNKTSI